MMTCPSCRSYSESRVVDSRPIERNSCIRRRRVCGHCSHRWTTYERENEPQRVLGVVEAGDDIEYPVRI